MATGEYTQRDPFKLNVDAYQYLDSLRLDEYENLKQSIAAQDLIDPVQIDELDNVLDGHHRVKACRELRLASIPVIINRGLTDEQKDIFSVEANVKRRQVTLVECKAKARELYADGWTQAKIAKAFGVTQGTISKWLSDKNYSNGIITPDNSQARHTDEITQEQERRAVAEDRAKDYAALKLSNAEKDRQLAEAKSLIAELQATQAPDDDAIAAAKQAGRDEVQAELDELKKHVGDLGALDQQAQIKRERIARMNDVLTSCELAKTAKELSANALKVGEGADFFMRYLDKFNPDDLDISDQFWEQVQFNLNFAAQEAYRANVMIEKHKCGLSRPLEIPPDELTKRIDKVQQFINKKRVESGGFAVVEKLDDDNAELCNI